jgi:hypothetical protein
VATRSLAYASGYYGRFPAKSVARNFKTCDLRLVSVVTASGIFGGQVSRTLTIVPPCQADSQIV